MMFGSTRKLRPWLVATCVVVAAALLIGARSAVLSVRIRANPLNTGDVMTMLRNFKADKGHYPKSLSELEPYNFTANNPKGRREKAQDLEVNVWGQRYIYLSDGETYSLVSPGQHGYQRARVIPWPEFDGAHHADTSLVVVN